MNISFVIPTFNSESSIVNCLNSIINQENQVNNIQIVIVDDGSTDNTVKLVKESFARYISQITIVEKNHSNAGEARNIGITKCTGEYIWFVDSDDMIAPDALNKLNSAINKYGKADIIEFCYYLYSEEKGSVRNSFNIDQQLLSQETVEGLMYTVSTYPKILKTIGYPWNKIYKYSFVKENNIKFSELNVNNDLAFKIKAEVLSKSIMFIHDELYTHVIDKKTCNGIPQITKITDRTRLQVILAFDDIENTLKDSAVFNNYETKKNYYLFKFKTLGWAYNKIQDEYKKELSDIITNAYLKIEPVYRYICQKSDYVESGFKAILKNIPTIDPCFNIMCKKNTDPLVSVIVTTYNVEPYISQCLDSLVKQNFSRFNYEIIVIDDGSTDNTKKIIYHYEQLYNNIHSIFFETNTKGGVATAANVGLRNATGKYILFCDGDDYVEPTFIKEMFDAALTADADIAVSNFKLFNNTKNKIINSPDNRLFNEIVSKRQESKDIKKYLLRLNPVPWRKIYSRHFLNKNSLFFIESEFFFEDNPFHWQTVIKSEKVAFINKPLIIHRIARDGQTTSGKDRRYFGFINHYIDIRNFLKNDGLFDLYKYDLLRWIFGQSIWIIKNLANYKKEYASRLSSELLKDYTVKDLVITRKIYPNKYSTFLFQKEIMSGNYFRAVGYKKIINPFEKLYALIISRK